MLLQELRSNITLDYVHNVEVEVEKLNVPIDSVFTKISAKIKEKSNYFFDIFHANIAIGI